MASQMRVSSIRLVRSFDEAMVKGFFLDTLGHAKRVLETWGCLS